MDEATLTQIFLDHWKQRDPKTFKSQNKDFLMRNAQAAASMAMAEIKATIWPGQMVEQVWSEIAPEMLKWRCPKA